MDRINEKILSLLQENARRSFSELGRLVSLSTNATAARVRRLEADGIILGYTVLRRLKKECGAAQTPTRIALRPR